MNDRAAESEGTEGEEETAKAAVPEPSEMPTTEMRIGKVTLAPGIEILIRPIQPDDKRLLTSSFEKLSSQSKYQRFFSPVERLSEKDLEYLTEVDHVNHEALIAIDPDDGDLVGVARYVRIEPPNRAEIAVIVSDHWQGRGLGNVLLEGLVARARAAGIDEFLAVVLRSNEEARTLFENLIPGGSHTNTGDPGQVEILIDIPERGRFRESRLSRIFSSTARGNLSFMPLLWLRKRMNRHHEDQPE